MLMVFLMVLLMTMIDVLVTLVNVYVRSCMMTTAKVAKVTVERTKVKVDLGQG